MSTIAVINQKGGVGKTTTTANLAHALARSGKKVTVIDFDPQGQLAVALGVVDRQQGIAEVMLEGKDIRQLLLEVRENLQLLAAGTRLMEIEQLRDGGVQRGELLSRALQNSLQDQDYVFIDCPPSSGLLAANALFASDEILIPMAGDFLALQGLSHLLGTLKKFEQALQKKYKKRLIMSRYCSTRRISRQVLNTLCKHFPGQILPTVIRETVLLAECPGFGKTILEYRPGSRPARDFRGLADDFLTGRVM